MGRTYIECGIWHLGGRKKQREVFLSPLGTPYTRYSRLLLVPAAGAIGGEVLNGLQKRFFWKKTKKTIRKKTMQKETACLETICLETTFCHKGLQL